MALIIHEITHCYADNHGKKFQEVLKKKAEIAKNRSLNKIYDLVMKDIESYRAPSDIGTREYVYRRLYEVLLDHPRYTYRYMLTEIAKYLNMYPHEVERKYKRFRKVFEKGKRDGIENEKGISLKEIKRVQISVLKTDK